VVAVSLHGVVCTRVHITTMLDAMCVQVMYSWEQHEAFFRGRQRVPFTYVHGKEQHAKHALAHLHRVHHQTGCMAFRAGHYTCLEDSTISMRSSHMTRARDMPQHPTTNPSKHSATPVVQSQQRATSQLRASTNCMPTFSIPSLLASPSRQNTIANRTSHGTGRQNDHCWPG
jgi:hypothetical protein